MSERTRKEQIQEMLAADPNDSFLRYALAMEHLGAGELEEAIRCWQDLLARDPNYVPAYLQAGQALVQLGRREEGRELWQRGVAAARQQGDQHAAEEMQRFLQLG